MRRDYRELVPLLRHRHEPDHPAVLALLARPRDVRLTIDARAAACASRRSSRATRGSRAGGKAAAVVLDPDTRRAAGQRELSVAGPGDADGEQRRRRRRCAARSRAIRAVSAGLDVQAGDRGGGAAPRHRISSRTTFACARLPDGRVGARIAGWTRPVRDDVLDTHPHGTIDMHDGLVHSCNAYFAQLALPARAGAAPRDGGAAGHLAGAVETSVQRVRDTLPQAGYGQGDVLATPLRMARVAAAIASDGVLRDVRWEQARPPSRRRPDVLLPPDAARLLARYMRDAVVSGTGRSLQQSPVADCGEDGHGGSRRRGVARLVRRICAVRAGDEAHRLRRHHRARRLRGTGGAPVAGEIVTAAAAAGLVR